MSRHLLNTVFFIFDWYGEVALIHESRSTVNYYEPLKMPTWLPTINSARTTFTSQPPLIRKEIAWPMILKDGEVRVPCGPSPCICPAVTDLLGRFSAPPIHQSPCWLAGCPMLRAVGLSPYVGWLLNAVPVQTHSPIPSSKSNLQSAPKK